MASLDDLCRLPAHAMARLVRERTVSAVQLLDAQLARVDQHNRTLNAVVSVDPGRARRQAAAADTALTREQPVGPLHGVPMTLKDGIDVAGLRSTLGTFELDRVAAAPQARPARRPRRAQRVSPA